VFDAVVRDFTAAQVTPSEPVAPRLALDVEKARRISGSRSKRAADICFSVIGLVVLAPVFAVIALAVLADSGRPVFYGQKRVTLDRRRGVRANPRERTFTCWKFRTMVRGADGMRDQFVALNIAPFPAFKLLRDPRTTRVGRFLRKSSLDELPQLWNVLRGEMSLVGPRPPLPEEVARYGEFDLQRLAVRPGITCTWQIENRQCGRDLRFDDWVRQDLDYIEKWDLRLDVVLLARTIRAVTRMTGQ
jgi:lipopolysaccharide/colanic/teichoic acid biosynthesis glycosyltransferase